MSESESPEGFIVGDFHGTRHFIRLVLMPEEDRCILVHDWNRDTMMILDIGDIEELTDLLLDGLEAMQKVTEYKAEREEKRVACPICFGSGKLKLSGGTVDCGTCQGQGWK